MIFDDFMFFYTLFFGHFFFFEWVLGIGQLGWIEED